MSFDTPVAFVEEFLRRTIGLGKGCNPAGVVELFKHFGRLPVEKQKAILRRFDVIMVAWKQ